MILYNKNNSKSLRKGLESLSTIGWFLMDVSWAYNFRMGAILFMVIALLSPLLECLFPNTEIPGDERISHWATLMWVLTNSVWMLGDYYNNILFSISKLWFASIGGILLVGLGIKNFPSIGKIRKIK